jgi:hypothetical protein
VCVCAFLQRWGTLGGPGRSLSFGCPPGPTCQTWKKIQSPPLTVPTVPLSRFASGVCACAFLQRWGPFGGPGLCLRRGNPPTCQTWKHRHQPPSVRLPSPHRRKPRVPTHDLDVRTASACVRSIRIRCESCTEAVSAVGQGGWTAQRARVPTPSHQTSGPTSPMHNPSVATVSALGFSTRRRHPSPTVRRISRRPPLRASLQTCPGVVTKGPGVVSCSCRIILKRGVPGEWG